ncbi:mitochondrial carrier protein-like protein [Sporormia fimetaria CBS 119925]|uniref:Mitochondrial carrier protein-like protein n=1 Tax=Sporormia fimetaria CBS 119925 TaxID=1340428 RepID=A0A6A6V5I5_9PLEO|nr:mitochondrial carrier protein-like protein [Sporormia fimetaria CBS 119925]
MSGNSNTDILIAGAVAAFTVDLLVYPLDTLKTRIQSPDYSRIYLNATTQKPNPALFRGLYQGVGSVIIATLPSSGAFFTTYERTKSLLHTLNDKRVFFFSLPTPLLHAFASSTAELVSCAILTPAEVIKQNAQMVDTTSSSSSSRLKPNATLQTLAKFKSNPLALWRGYTALAGRNLPFTALQFPVFERTREGILDWRERRGRKTGSLWERGVVTALSAGSAGALAAVVTTPVDVVKTRIMLSAIESEDASAGGEKGKQAQKGLVDALGKAVQAKKKAKRKSAWGIGQEIVKEKGFVGLWRGGALRAVWTFAGSGLYLGVYESGRLYLARRRGDGEDVDAFT